MADGVISTMARLFPDRSASAQQMATEEFEVRGLVIPQGNIML